MPKTPVNWARVWAVIRAVFGVVGAATVLALSVIVAIRLRHDNGQNGSGGQSAASVEQQNSDARKGLEEAMDILRRARRT